MHDPHRLHVYQVARTLTRQAYAVAVKLPPDERFTLGKQIRRAAVSIGSNIAEGCGRRTPRNFAQFLGIALGSSRELEFQLVTCQDLFFSGDALVGRALATNSRVQLMLIRLIGRVESPRAEPPPRDAPSRPRR